MLRIYMHHHTSMQQAAPNPNVKNTQNVMNDPSLSCCRIYWQYSRITRFNSASACVQDSQSDFLGAVAGIGVPHGAAWRTSVFCSEMEALEGFPSFTTIFGSLAI